MDAWSHFANETQYGVLVKEFFLKLSSEIAEVTADSNKKDGVLILNTKKGYWMYKVFENKELTAPSSRFDVRSDRYIKQLADFAVLQDKLIYLVDDTLSNGNALLGTYELLAKRIDIKNICPIVFAISDKVDIEKKKLDSKGVALSFWNKLKYFVKMSEGDMGLFCVHETKLLHQVGVPYVIGLPYLKEEGLTEENEQEMKFQVNFTKEQFEKIQQESENWKFHFNTRMVDKELLLHGFIIQMLDEQLLVESREEILDLTVAGTYTIEDEEIKVVFVPFAIVGSLDKNYLLNLYRTLFEDTNVTFSQDAEWIGCYQECVYTLSTIVGECFIEHLEQITGIRLAYDYNILKDHFNESFKEKAEVFTNRIKNDLTLVKEKLMKINDYEFVRLNQESSDKETYSDQSAYDLVLNEVLKKRSDFLVKSHLHKGRCVEWDSVLEINKMRKLLDEKFLFSSKAERRFALSYPTISNLQASICSTRLIISRDGSKIEKGLRYGEISDLVLPFFDLGFYWAVLLLVEKIKDNDILIVYDQFAFGLKKKFVEWGVMGKKITEDDFENNKRYYKIVLENDLQLKNKYFYLQPYLQGNLNVEQNGLMSMIEDFVQDLKC